MSIVKITVKSGKQAGYSVNIARDDAPSEIEKTIDGTLASSATPRRLSLAAVIEGLEYLSHHPVAGDTLVTINLSEDYVVNGINYKWPFKWAKNGWLTTQHTPIQNRDLWERYLALAAEMTIRADKPWNKPGDHAVAYVQGHVV